MLFRSGIADGIKARVGTENAELAGIGVAHHAEMQLHGKIETVIQPAQLQHQLGLIGRQLLGGDGLAFQQAGEGGAGLGGVPHGRSTAGARHR